MKPAAGEARLVAILKGGYRGLTLDARKPTWLGAGFSPALYCLQGYFNPQPPHILLSFFSCLLPPSTSSLLEFVLRMWIQPLSTRGGLAFLLIIGSELAVSGPEAQPND